MKPAKRTLNALGDVVTCIDIARTRLTTFFDSTEIRQRATRDVWRATGAFHDAVEDLAMKLDESMIDLRGASSRSRLGTSEFLATLTRSAAECGMVAWSEVLRECIRSKEAHGGAWFVSDCFREDPMVILLWDAARRVVVAAHIAETLMSQLQQRAAA